jgi:nicotinamidase-related amidase
MKKGLILVDIQKDYFEGGRYELVNPVEAVEQAGKILSHFRRKGWHVFHVQHISTNTDAGFFIPNTEGIEFHNEISPVKGEVIITKHRPDSFLNTNLKEKLEDAGIDQLVVCGMMTHMCIDTTIRTANSYGYAVTLIEDGCATRDLAWGDNIVPAEQVHCAYMAALNGSFAKVIKADAWIKE